MRDYYSRGAKLDFVLHKNYKMLTVIEIFRAHKNPVSRIKPPVQDDLFKKKKTSKYLNKWVVIDNINFQSEGEGYYYLELKALMLRGEVKEIKRQIPFEFMVNDVKVGKYVADFGVLYHDGRIEIIDYKSRFTVTLALYQIKKALMLACYGVIIKEVGVKK